MRMLFILVVLLIIIAIIVIYFYIRLLNKKPDKDEQMKKLVKKANKMVQDICATIDEKDYAVFHSKINESNGHSIYVNFHSDCVREVLMSVILHLSILLSDKYPIKVRDIKRKLEQAAYNLGYLSYSLTSSDNC